MDSELQSNCNDRLLGSEGMDKQSINSEAEEEPQDLRWFTPSFIIAEVLGIIAVTLVITWFGQFHEGYSWTASPESKFNFHPVLMMFGMIFLYANAIMIYRIFRNERKKKIKYLHGALHCSVFILSVVALQAVFQMHNDRHIPNMYSAHSWLGITTVIIFCFQYVAGFISFLFPGLRMNLRAQYLPIHVFFGVGCFLLAVSTAFTGIIEKAFFAMKDNYKEFPSEGILVNCLVVILVLFAFVVTFVVVNPNYKRRLLPEEQMPLVIQHQN